MIKFPTALKGFGAPFGVHQDQQNRFYIADLRHNEVYVHDSTGNRLGVLRQDGLQREPTTPPCFKGPHSVVENSKGEIFVCAYYQKKIFRFDPELSFGQVLLDHATLNPPWLLSGPATTTIGPDDLIYVSDYGSSSLQRFSPEGKFEAWLGYDPKNSTSGWKTTGQPQSTASDHGFDHLHDVAFDKEENFYIADTRNHRVLKFDKSGECLGWNGKSKTTAKTCWGFEGKGESAVGSEFGAYDGPTSVDISGDEILVTNLRNNRLELFDTKGQFIAWYGGHQEEGGEAKWYTEGKSASGDQPGRMNWPYDAKFVKEGIAVADSRNSRVNLIPFLSRSPED